jgi:hypothetical protein
MFPVYVRGEAYLAAHQGSEAAAEFQKILDHRGVVLNELIGALAHLQLHQIYPLPSGGSFVLENVNGSVQVEGWSRDEVEVS